MLSSSSSFSSSPRYSTMILRSFHYTPRQQPRAAGPRRDFQDALKRMQGQVTEDLGRMRDDVGKRGAEESAIGALRLPEGNHGHPPSDMIGFGVCDWEVFRLMGMI